jgi:hypothetical protein
MSARLVKYCPLCGAANDPTEPFCTACGDGELIDVAPEPMREAPPQMPQAAAAPAAPQAEGAGAGPAQHGPDTLHVEAEQAQASIVLELIESPETRFTVRDGQSVGASREAERTADVTLTGVPALEYISSMHARCFLRGGQWYVQHLGNTNFIKVDGMKFEKREEVPLRNGTVLVLSKTPFRVVIDGGG